MSKETYDRWTYTGKVHCINRRHEEERNFKNSNKEYNRNDSEGFLRMGSIPYWNQRNGKSLQRETIQENQHPICRTTFTSYLQKKTKIPPKPDEDTDFKL